MYLINGKLSCCSTVAVSSGSGHCGVKFDIKSPRFEFIKDVLFVVVIGLLTLDESVVIMAASYIPVSKPLKFVFWNFDSSLDL